MNNKRWRIGFVFLIVFITLWYLAIVPEFENVHSDYENTINYKRLSNTNYEIGGNWTGEQLIAGTTIEKTIKLEKDVWVMESNYVAKGLDGNIVWEVKKEYGIEKKTKKILENYGEYSKDTYYIFPTHLKKQNYNLWFPQYLYPINLEFEDVEKIRELEVYHFQAKNFIFDDTAGFEWLELVPEKYRVLADGTVNIWVEPKTGIIIDFKGGGVAYYADKDTNEKIQDMQTWSNEYGDNTITTQVVKAQNEKFKYILIRTIIPILLALTIIVITLVLSLKKEEDKR